jgi:class 3 adenylate cyclase/predicted ATPase/ABC-type transport system involved in cytochrome c biogenesis ATPase subunit
LKWTIPVATSLRSGFKRTAQILRSLGLEQYEAAFRENAIDDTVLLNLTAEDLKDLGVGLVGHRRKLLDAIAALRADAAKSTAERRQVTVMFSDLVGSTALAARMDPEDLREVISAYQNCVAETVRRFDGFVARYMGDGVLVYFGYPRAHDDDAERAVQAGLELIAAVLASPVSLQTRVGIATGLVVIGSLIGSGEAQERGIVGETPNLAARLQEIAAPNTVVIEETTRKLVGNFFELESLGEKDLKGIPRSVQIWTPLRAKLVESRFEALHPTGLTTLVGREKELELLMRLWSKAKSGEGQVVLLSGEAGIGKSRLTAALLENIAREPHTRLRYFCSAHHTQSALSPFINQLQHAAGFKHSDSPKEKLSKLNALLAQSTHDPEDVAILADLLALPVDDHYRFQDLTSQKRKEKTFAALLAQVDRLAARQPVLLIFEDVHWIDPSSLELLAATMEHVTQLRVLLLVTARPQLVPPWPSYPHLTTIALTRLDRRDGAAMILRLTGGKTLPKEVMDQILTHTDGIPLFIEELTKMVLESGLLRERDGGYGLDGPLPPLAIPTTLQASLTARLDRLSPVREVAQIGAAVGREFDYELLRGIAGLPKHKLDDALNQLVRSELIFCRGKIPHAVYTFKHALVRDAAYAGLLKGRRLHLHGAIAKVLEQEFPEVLQAQPEIVAYHYAEARSYEKALRYWYQAGKRSAARSAHNEAVGHLKQGLAQLPNIDDPMLRNKSELLLQTALGNSLRAIKGWSTGSVKQAYTRALQLCKETGLDEHVFPAVFGLWTWNFLHTPLDEAQALAEHLMKIADNLDDSVYKVLAHEALGFTSFAQGKLAAGHAALQRSISLCEDSKVPVYLDLSAQDPRVHVRSYDGMALWFLGYPDQALRSCAEARLYADKSQHPFSQAMARAISLRVHQFRGEAAVVAAQADGAIALCEEHEFVHYLAMALILRGWARASQGEFEKGIAEIQEGLEKERATGALLFESYSLGLLADACIKNARYGQAFEFLEQARLRLDDENSERFYAAEIYRLLGETYLRSHQHLDQAERYFCNGLKVAREQEARSLELKLCMSICELYELRQKQNADKYRSQLGEIYGSFCEGFDTTDLVRAKTMLKLPDGDQSLH